MFGQHGGRQRPQGNCARCGQPQAEAKALHNPVARRIEPSRPGSVESIRRSIAGESIPHRKPPMVSGHPSPRSAGCHGRLLRGLRGSLLFFHEREGDYRKTGIPLDRMFAVQCRPSPHPAARIITRKFSAPSLPRQSADAGRSETTTNEYTMRPTESGGMPGSASPTLDSQ